ncbi:hypothetical protein Esti_001301 [Eimeria stiedai]
MASATSGVLPPPLQVPVVEGSIPSEFFSCPGGQQRQPCVCRGLYVGACVNAWKEEGYLERNTENKLVSVHVAPQPSLVSFKEKNFKYVKVPLHELLQRARGGLKKQLPPFICQGEGYYLRDVGAANPNCSNSSNSSSNGSDNGSSSNSSRNNDGATTSLNHSTNTTTTTTNTSTNTNNNSKRSSKKQLNRACFFRDYPELAKDVTLPITSDSDSYFSSVLRISSSGFRLFTHYDVLDNLYLQAVGSKEVTLWAPSEALSLYLEGDKSLVVDIERADPQRFPLFSQTPRFFATLQPGDLLFIPALWLHNTKSLGFGVAINIFWRHLPLSLFDSRDVYGNTDLLPAQQAKENVAKAIKQLQQLPEDHRDFYGRLLIRFGRAWRER